MTRRKADEVPVVRVQRVGGTAPSRPLSIRKGSAAHLMLVALSTSSELSAGECGIAGWPGTVRKTPTNGGGDMAAQMWLGRMKSHKLVEHAPSVGSSMWRITYAGRTVLRQLAGMT